MKNPLSKNTDSLIKESGVVLDTFSKIVAKLEGLNQKMGIKKVELADEISAKQAESESLEKAIGNNARVAKNIQALVVN